jgi:hypothetical protein
MRQAKRKETDTMGIFSVVPYLSTACTTVFLGWTLMHIPPSSPNRYLMLPLIVSTATVTSITASYASGVAPWNNFVAMEYGSLLILQIFDKVCLSRLYYPDDIRPATLVPKDGDTQQPIESTWTRSLNALRWSVDLIINKRRVRTASQVKNVPPFNPKMPEQIPSLRSFLLFRAVRFSLLYLLLEFMTSQHIPDVESKFARGKERILTRILARQFSLADMGETVGVVAGFWVCSFFMIMMTYDFFSLVGVSLGINQVADWPPIMGSVKEIYSVRRFWGSVYPRPFRLMFAKTRQTKRKRKEKKEREGDRGRIN